MSHSFHHQPEGAPSAQTLPPQPIADDALPPDLREHVQRLRLVLPAISASVLALHGQNAELHTEIASVLSQHACERRDRETAHLASILTSRAWPPRQQEAQS